MPRLWIPALAVIGLLPQVTRGAILVSSSFGDFTLAAPPLADEGLLLPEVHQGLQSSGVDGSALAAVQLDVQPRSARLAAWAGAQSVNDQGATATAQGSASVLLLPDEGEQSGDAVTLYAQLVVRVYGGTIFEALPAEAALLADAKIWTASDGSLLKFSEAGVAAFPATIGKHIHLALFAQANSGAVDVSDHNRYAAMDLQLVLGFDSTPPVDLLPLPVVPGDATLNGIVDGGDYTVWANSYLQTTALGGWAGDFTRDGIVDGADYTLWANNYAPQFEGLTARVVPEPSTRFLAALALAGMVCPLVRRRLRP